MRVGSRGTIFVVFTVLLAVTKVSGQNRVEPKPQMAEEVFKNIQVLKGITVSEFMDTMGFFSASTLLNCTDCHTKESTGSWGKYADDTPLKRTARRMVLMVRTINQSSFGGRSVVTCYTCHRGDEFPKGIPNLAEMYGTPPFQEPDQVSEQTPGAPTADALLDKYFAAIGGAQKVGGVTSMVAKGVYEGSPVSLMTGKSLLEIYAKAPDQRTTIIHTDAGDATTAFDGHTAWSSAPTQYSPMPVLPLAGTDLDAAKMEAELTFPGRLKQTLTDWRVGFPFVIDNNEVQVVQGTGEGKLPVKLYFDSKSGLLVRVVRYKRLPIGLNPIQIDYSDYRDVSGIKIPFRMKLTGVDGLATVTLSDVQLNVPIEAAKFAKPAPSVAGKTAVP